MPYLQNEKVLAQAEVHASESDVASLTGQVESQEQNRVSAQVDADGARSRLAARLAERPALEAAAAADDAEVADIDRQIEEHQQTEPEKTIERPNKPPLPNPEWKTWKEQLDELERQRSRAQADADAAHARLAVLNGAISQANADIQGAEARVAQVTATIGQLGQALEAARNRLRAAGQALDDVTRWSDEIDRQALDRPALEQTAAALSGRVLELEDAVAEARAASRKADAALASLTRRRDQLIAALADVNGQLPPANEAVSVADAAAADLAQQIDEHISGGV